MISPSSPINEYREHIEQENQSVGCLTGCLIIGGAFVYIPVQLALSALSVNIPRLIKENGVLLQDAVDEIKSLPFSSVPTVLKRNSVLVHNEILYPFFNEFFLQSIRDAEEGLRLSQGIITSISQVPVLKMSLDEMLCISAGGREIQSIGSEIYSLPQNIFLQSAHSFIKENIESIQDGQAASIIQVKRGAGSLQQSVFILKIAENSLSEVATYFMTGAQETNHSTRSIGKTTVDVIKHVYYPIVHLTKESFNSLSDGFLEMAQVSKASYSVCKTSAKLGLESTKAMGRETLSYASCIGREGEQIEYSLCSIPESYLFEAAFSLITENFTLGKNGLLECKATIEEEITHVKQSVFIFTLFSNTISEMLSYIPPGAQETSQSAKWVGYKVLEIGHLFKNPITSFTKEAIVYIPEGYQESAKISSHTYSISKTALKLYAEMGKRIALESYSYLESGAKEGVVLAKDIRMLPQNFLIEEAGDFLNENLITIKENYHFCKASVKETVISLSHSLFIFEILLSTGLEVSSYLQAGAKESLYVLNQTGKKIVETSAYTKQTTFSVLDEAIDYGRIGSEEIMKLCESVFSTAKTSLILSHECMRAEVEESFSYMGSGARETTIFFYSLKSGIRAVPFSLITDCFNELATTVEEGVLEVYSIRPCSNHLKLEEMSIKNALKEMIISLEDIYNEGKREMIYQEHRISKNWLGGPVKETAVFLGREGCGYFSNGWHEVKQLNSHLKADVPDVVKTLIVNPYRIWKAEQDFKWEIRRRNFNYRVRVINRSMRAKWQQAKHTWRELTGGATV